MELCRACQVLGMAGLGTSAYQGLLASIQDGLQRCDSIAARTRSHGQAEEISFASSSECSESADSRDQAQHASGGQAAESHGEAHASESNDTQAAALAGPHAVGGNGDPAQAWPVAAWQPSIDAAPAEAVQAAQRQRSRKPAAATLRPGAAKLVGFWAR